MAYRNTRVARDFLRRERQRPTYLKLLLDQRAQQSVQFLSYRTCCGRTVGMVENRLLFVSYTLRGTGIRIISARAAEPFE